LPYVHPQLLHEREGETRRAVVEHSACDLKFGFVEHDSGYGLIGWQLAALESVAGAEQAFACETLSCEFGCRDNEVGRVFAHQVPGIRTKLVPDSFGEAAGADQMKRLGSIETDAQQPIEAGEMVHVGMGYESVAHAQELARG